MDESATYRLACDIGGTFTDFYLINRRSGEIDVEKCLTTPADPSIGVLNGIELLARRNPEFLRSTECVFHATTLVINAIIERKGARTGLLTTKGFRDVLEIGREMRYDLYDIFIEFPAPLVPRYMREEIAERVYQNGALVTPVDAREIEASIARLQAHGMESLAVCFLHSYANPKNEVEVKAALAKIAPQLPVSISSEVLPEVREYERTTTTVVNAYVKPLTARYTARLLDGLRSLGFRRQLLIMLSSGGMASADTAAQFPVRIVESGPAAGAIAAAFVGKLADCPEHLLAFDMGGTTAKGCVIRHGWVEKATVFEAARRHRFKKGSGIPLRIPVVDLIEIGAGGGSIARVGPLGLIQVGPDSAGASPGPACYGLGGREPTVSDANLVLGYLNAEYFLGGSMPLDTDAARRAIGTRLAEPMGLTLEHAARGIHGIVTENMASAIRIHMAEKGVDPSQFTIVAFGGGGPIHAFALARKLGVRRVLIPPGAGIASAFGLLVSPISFDLVRTHRVAIADMDAGQVGSLFEEMSLEAKDLVTKAEAASAVTFTRSMDLCYLGQGHYVNVPMEVEHGIPSKDEIRKRFEDVYLQLYGRAYPDMDVQLMNLRVVAQSAAGSLELRKLATGGAAEEAVKGRREAYSAQEGRYVAHTVYDRYRLGPGAVLQGPAIVEERESTVIVDIGGRIEVDAYGTLVMSLGDD